MALVVFLDACGGMLIASHVIATEKFSQKKLGIDISIRDVHGGTGEGGGVYVFS